MVPFIFKHRLQRFGKILVIITTMIGCLLEWQARRHAYIFFGSEGFGTTSSAPSESASGDYQLLNE